MTSNLIEHNPRLKKPVVRVLATMQELEDRAGATGAHEACDTQADAARGTRENRTGTGAGVDREQLEELLAARWEPSFAQIPATVIDVLVRNGALTQQLFVDGEPYAGTLADMQFDDAIEPGACITALVSTTREGCDLLASLDPSTTLQKLIEGRPFYADVFKRAIACCVAAEGGATRAQLEQAIELDGPVASPDGTRVYPQFFIDALESAGGIEWQGAWCATATGRAWSAAAAERSVASDYAVADCAAAGRAAFI